MPVLFACIVCCYCVQAPLLLVAYERAPDFLDDGGDGLG